MGFSHGSNSHSQRRGGSNYSKERILVDSTMTVQNADQFYQLVGFTDAVLSEYEDIIVRVAFGAVGSAGVRDYRFSYDLWSKISALQVGDSPTRAISGGAVTLGTEDVCVFFGRCYPNLNNPELSLGIALSHIKHIVVAAFGINY